MTRPHTTLILSGSLAQVDRKFALTGARSFGDCVNVIHKSTRRSCCVNSGQAMTNQSCSAASRTTARFLSMAVVCTSNQFHEDTDLFSWGQKNMCSCEMCSYEDTDIYSYEDTEICFWEDKEICSCEDAGDAFLWGHILISTLRYVFEKTRTYVLVRNWRYVLRGDGGRF